MSCAGLFAAAAGGCNAIIGLEVGELDPSQAGAGAGAASVSGATSSSSGDGAGGAGAGGAGAASTSGSGGAGAGGSGAGGEGAGGDGGGGSGGGGPLCSEAGGAIITPSGAWGETVGFDVGDLASLDDAVAAVFTDTLDDGRYRFSVAKWSEGGARNSGYGLSANDVWGSHLAAGKDFTYVAGEAQGAVDLPGGVLGCRVGPPLLGTSNTLGFVAALDTSGRCAWAWGLDSDHGITARDLAATSEAVIFAVDFDSTGKSTTFGPCKLDDLPTNSTLVAAVYPEDGACKWKHTLGPRESVTVKALAADSRPGSRLTAVVGDYDARSGEVSFGGATPFASQGRDIFVARFVSSDGAMQEVTTLTAKGDQYVPTHGAALLPGGDVVIAGMYRETLGFGDACPRLPDAGDTENFFIARVSESGVVWSRGFGDATADQTATAVAVDDAGSIYVTGHFEGAIALGSAGTLMAERRAGFLMRLDSRGNLVSAARFQGNGAVALRGVAAGRAPGAPLYVAGEVTGTLDLGLDEPLGSGGDDDSDDGDPGSRGFIVRLSGVR
ncbi:hypothetical protein [Sorangium sp. So ce1389]|uniref:hypothetical protein n=1 Tax=Sorangium sp. So ce1389 TaxID=3133336 RepID=UPI003F639A84